MDSVCPLCRTNNLLKSDVIADTPKAYLIESPSKPGNYLIIPNEHIELLTKLPDDWWVHVTQLLPQIPNLPEHYNMSINYGEHAGQSVKHLHFWIVPRKAGQLSSGKGLALLIEEANTKK